MATKTLSQDDVLDAIANWSVLELSEFVKAFEDKFGVTAAAPVAAAAAPGGGGGEAAAVEEKDRLAPVLGELAELGEQRRRQRIAGLPPQVDDPHRRHRGAEPRA
jgi:ribosomal protein L7/L12